MNQHIVDILPALKAKAWLEEYCEDTTLGVVLAPWGLAYVLADREGASCSGGHATFEEVIAFIREREAELAQTGLLAWVI